MDNLLDVSTAARRLGVSASFLNKRRVYGDGPPFIKLGGRVLYREVDLDTWVTERLHRSTSEFRPGS